MEESNGHNASTQSETKASALLDEHLQQPKLLKIVFASRGSCLLIFRLRILSLVSLVERRIKDAGVGIWKRLLIIWKVRGLLRKVVGLM